jgi:K+-sensing histidine kinase KdpD
MQKIFSNILVPVFFDKKTELVIQKAIDFANEMDCHLHILYIESPSFLKTPFSRGILLDKQYKLFRFREKFQKKLNPGLKFFTGMEKGHFDKVITKYTDAHSIDLILVGERSRKFLFFKIGIDPTMIADKVSCPVLFTSYKPAFPHFAKIVLPIGTSIPVHRIRVTIYLARQFKATIHLLALENNGLNYEEMACMEKTFRVLKENTELPVVCTTLEGNDVSNASAQYSNSISEGLLVVNPGSDALLPNSMRRQLSRFLVKESHAPGLALIA